MDDAKTLNLSTYNQRAGEFAEKFDSFGPRIETIERAFSFAEHKLNPFVVEIGCANGRDAVEILKRTDKYLGIDISAKLIDLAKQKLPGINFIVADALVFEFPDDIDIVFALASLIHVDKSEFKKILERLHSKLNEDGIVYLSLKHGEYQEKVQKDNFGTRIFYWYSDKDIKELSGDIYKIVKSEVIKVMGQDWLDIVLKKR